ncbi:MAG: hypothetical protein NTZ05_06575 [Chloroflexi bacterium]|nr:hypothetical protein [Chloroflexota bacterium]
MDSGDIEDIMPKRRNPVDLNRLLPRSGNPALDALADAAVQRAAGHVFGMLPPAAQEVAGALYSTLTEQPPPTAQQNPAAPAPGEVARFMQSVADLESGVIPILGRKGMGKSSLSFKLGQTYHDRGRPVYVVGVRQDLLDVFGFQELDPNQVDQLPVGSVVIVDDAGVISGNRDYSAEASRRLQAFLIITRHKDTILIWSNINASLVNVHLLNADVFFLKPQSEIGEDLERTSLRKISQQAEAAFAGKPDEVLKGMAYAHSESLGFRGTIRYTPPRGWSEKVSKNKA